MLHCLRVQAQEEITLWAWKVDVNGLRLQYRACSFCNRVTFPDTLLILFSWQIVIANKLQ